MLFLMQNEEVKLKNFVREKIGSINETFKHEYKIHILDQPIQICYEEGSGRNNPGSTIQFQCQKQHTFHSTAGAFVKDEQEALYILTSCHGCSIQHCYFIESGGQNRYECEYITDLFHKDPFLDACILKVTDKRLQNNYTYSVPGEAGPIAFCGPYTESLEEMTDTDKGVEVMKYGGRTKLTKGLLSYHHFCVPSEGITGGFLITPADGTKAFTDDGDCGSVVFLSTPRNVDGKLSYHEALAIHANGVKGLFKDGKCSLAFRIDHALEYFQEHLDTTLRLLPSVDK